MGQEILFSILPRVNHTPADLVYRRRVARSDRSSCRSSLNEDEREAENSEELLPQERRQKTSDSLGKHVDAEI